MNKITNEELQSLVHLMKSMADLKKEIADYEIKKHNAVNMVMSIGHDLNDLNSEMEQKYGKIKINLETGEYADSENIDRP